jgi:hypothetical protein
MFGDDNYAQQNSPVLDPSVEEFPFNVDNIDSFSTAPFLGGPYQYPTYTEPALPAQTVPTQLAHPRTTMVMTNTAAIANTPMQFTDSHSYEGHPAGYPNLISPEGQSSTWSQWPSDQYLSDKSDGYRGHLAPSPPAEHWNDSQQSLHFGGAAEAPTGFNMGSAVNVPVENDSANLMWMPRGLGDHHFNPALTQTNSRPSGRRRRPNVESTVQAVTEEMPAHAT